MWVLWFPSRTFAWPTKGLETPGTHNPLTNKHMSIWWITSIWTGTASPVLSCLAAVASSFATTQSGTNQKWVSVWSCGRQTWHMKPAWLNNHLRQMVQCSTPLCSPPADINISCMHLCLFLPASVECPLAGVTHDSIVLWRCLLWRLWDTTRGLHIL